MDDKQKKDFSEAVKEELYNQTFKARDSEFSAEKVKTLVQYLELEDPTDQEEMEKSKAQFMARFKKEHKKEIRRDFIRKHSRQLAEAFALAIILVIAADLTTQAIANESLFRMVNKWANYVEIIPGKSRIEDELASINESEVKQFDSAQDFADYFADDFLVCSWLPEGVELENILVSYEEGSPVILWNYIESISNESALKVRISEEANKDTAGLTAILKGDPIQMDVIHGINVSYYEYKEGYLAGFAYNNWWYFIEAQMSQEEFNLIIEGMMRYE